MNPKRTAKESKMLDLPRGRFVRGVRGGPLTAVGVFLLAGLFFCFTGIAVAEEKGEQTGDTQEAAVDNVDQAGDTTEGADATKEQAGDTQEGSTQTEGQSRESMANDSTAAAWSFQVAYEYSTWFDDQLPSGGTRPEGNKDFWQIRVVAPFSKESTGLPFTILPRLTLRNVQNKDGRSGGGNAEIFGLIVPLDWGTGRWGIGPQINFPADNKQLGTTEWRYGFATAGLQRALNDKVLYGILIQQVWGKTDPTRAGSIVASPITIQPVFNYALPKSFYLNIGETAFSYDWDAEAWLIPLGLRAGKLLIKEKSTWNFYVEYRRSVVYKDWPGPAAENSVRFNISYTMPVI